MNADSSPVVQGSFQWWCREGRISAEDGHPDAARAAYGQAMDVAETAGQRQLAEMLLADIPGKG